ncbi:hypothetical protein L6452_28641 [Arctium lappa]|uniref:Uncharacterized protein n=1 Tax=Arctium lappa TaxID=4217 RepID=A0ACB9A0C9_ARCLA|nr:hypothetical protein L6452_28641 [Arctium lappa]
MSSTIDAVGYSTSVEADRERRTLDPSKEYVFEEDSDGSELDEAIFEGFTEDDDDDDDEGDEDDDDDDAPSSGSLNTFWFSLLGMRKGVEEFLQEWKDGGYAGDEGWAACLADDGVRSETVDSPHL